MIETFTDADGFECCDNCGEPVDECTCTCVVCGDNVVECACDGGPTYPAVADY